MTEDPLALTSTVLMIISLSLLLRASNAFWRFGFAPIEGGYLFGLALQPIAIVLGAVSGGSVGSVSAIAAGVALLAFSGLYLLYRRTHLSTGGEASPGYKGWYTRRIRTLAGRVSKLKLRIKVTSTRGGAKTLEKEANTCYAFLEHLKAYARQHRVDTRPHQDMLKQIWLDLDEAGAALANKSEEWWSKLIRTVRDAIGLVNAILTLFGLVTDLQLPSAERLALPAGT